MLLDDRFQACDGGAYVALGGGGESSHTSEVVAERHGGGAEPGVVAGSARSMVEQAEVDGEGESPQRLESGEESRVVVDHVGAVCMGRPGRTPAGRQSVSASAITVACCSLSPPESTRDGPMRVSMTGRAVTTNPSTVTAI